LVVRARAFGNYFVVAVVLVALVRVAHAPWDTTGVAETYLLLSDNTAEFDFTPALSLDLVR
jgi:hypothetical protein